MKPDKHIAAIYTRINGVVVKKYTKIAPVEIKPAE
jgi:hypothetical protein